MRVRWPLFCLILTQAMCVALLPAPAARADGQAPRLYQAAEPDAADSEDDEEDAPAPDMESKPRERAHNREGAEGEEGGNSGLGVIRRTDTFDNWVDEAQPPRPHPAELANPGHDVVICEAGCDGPSGTVVYKQKRQAGTIR
jgi:hypothetical protein